MRTLWEHIGHDESTSNKLKEEIESESETLCLAHLATEMNIAHKLNIYTDASGSIGYGAVCDSQWFYGVWPESWRHYNITALELYPIVAAVVTWGVSWKNRSICFYTDNEALVSVINRQTSREKTVMTLLRKLVLRCLFFNILFTAKHVAGRDNSLADKLSRFQISEFRAMAPWAAEHPTIIPHHISPAGLGAL